MFLYQTSVPGNSAWWPLVSPRSDHLVILHSYSSKEKKGFLKVSHKSKEWTNAGFPRAAWEAFGCFTSKSSAYLQSFPMSFPEPPYTSFYHLEQTHARHNHFLSWIDSIQLEPGDSGASRSEPTFSSSLHPHIPAERPRYLSTEVQGLNHAHRQALAMPSWKPEPFPHCCLLCPLMLPPHLLFTSKWEACVSQVLKIKH